jgi:hypothetical protein
MTEPSLDRSGVVPLVGKSIAAGVAKHVRMGLQFEAGADGRALDQGCESDRLSASARVRLVHCPLSRPLNIYLGLSALRISKGAIHHKDDGNP